MMERRNIILGITGGILAFIITLVLLYIFLPVRRKRLTPGDEQGLARGDNDGRIVIEHSAQAQIDNLTRITGIGEKISTALLEAGITKFAQLASMDSDDIQLILDQANVQAVASPMWVEQASELAGEV